MLPMLSQHSNVFSLGLKLSNEHHRSFVAQKLAPVAQFEIWWKFWKIDFRMKKKFFRKIIDFPQILNWATGASFWATKLLWCSFESFRPKLNTFECCESIGSICTYQAHQTYVTQIIKKSYFFCFVCLMCAHNVTWGCSWLKSMGSGGSNAVSHVFLRQKLVSVAQIKVLHIWDRCASSGKKMPLPLMYYLSPNLRNEKSAALRIFWGMYLGRTLLSFPQNDRNE